MNYFKPSSGKTKVEVIKECIPNVYIDTVTLAKMKIFIDECNDEIGWLGTAYKVGNDIVINDVLLFKQEVHSTTTEITPEGLSEFGEEILSQENGVDLWNSIKVWGHSHANMSVFASGQDDAQMIVFKDSGHDWFVRIIANKKDDFKVDLYDYEKGVQYHDLEFYEVDEYTENIESEIDRLNDLLLTYHKQIEDMIRPTIKAEIEAKVSKLSYSNKTPVGYKTYFPSTSTESKVVELKTKDYDIKDIMSITEMKASNEADGINEYYFLDELASCKNIQEMRDAIDMWGFYDCYSDEELREMVMLYDSMIFDEDYYKTHYKGMGW